MTSKMFASSHSTRSLPGSESAVNERKDSEKIFDVPNHKTQLISFANETVMNCDDCQTVLSHESNSAEMKQAADIESNVSDLGVDVDKFVNNVDLKDSSGFDCRQKLVLVLFPVLPIFIMTLIYIFLRGVESDPDFEEFFDADPFSGVDHSNAYRWENRGRGLYIQVINALDDKWQPYYEQALSDWNNGELDVLSLESVRESPDAECDPVLGKIKVCNGDYGETGWKGTNTIIIEFGHITVSTAKLNDSYLKKDMSQFMQFTICHEMGHGFGVPHADENFYNVNLGTCMDYTRDPLSNERPNSADFELLAWLYGTRDGNWTSTSLSDQAFSEEQYMALPKDDYQSSIEQNKKNQNKEHHRSLRGQRHSLPSWVVSSVKILEKEFSRADALDSKISAHPGWRLLSKTDFMERHEVDLGSGYKVQLHKMLV